MCVCVYIHTHTRTIFLIFTEESNIILRQTGAFLLLPFLFSSVYVCKTWRPTRVDIMESFVTRVCSETEVEEHIEHRRKSRIELGQKSAKISTSVQPYVLAIGPT